MQRPGTKTNMKLIVACVVLASTFGAVAVYQRLDDSRLIDSQSLCHRKRLLAGHTAAVVDKTDILDDRQTQYIIDTINVLKDRLKPNELLSVTTITAEMDRFTSLVPIFKKCAPENGNDAIFLNKNPDRLRVKFEKQFVAPLQASLDRIKTVEEYPISPILETIQAISELPGFGDPTVPTKFVLFSDMLNNSAQFSQYSRKQPSFSDFKETDYYKSLKTRFGNTVAEIIYLVKPSTEIYQTPAHRKFWLDVLTDMGIKEVKIKVQRRF